MAGFFLPAFALDWEYGLEGSFQALETGMIGIWSTMLSLGRRCHDIRLERTVDYSNGKVGRYK